MEEVFADLHVHIGRSESGKPIKITAARSLNFANIARECADRKGINIVGIRFDRNNSYKSKGSKMHG